MRLPEEECDFVECASKLFWTRLDYLRTISACFSLKLSKVLLILASMFTSTILSRLTFANSLLVSPSSSAFVNEADVLPLFCFFRFFVSYYILALLFFAPPKSTFSFINLIELLLLCRPSLFITTCSSSSLSIVRFSAERPCEISCPF